MSDFIDFLPLYVRTEDEIRADMDADANAGVQPGDSDWVDTRPGGFFHLVTQPCVIELGRAHDRIATLPAVGFLEFAYGQYLDYHAADLNDARKAAAAAVSNALFTAPVGTVITTDTEISTEQIDENVQPIVFATTETVTVFGPISTPSGLAIVSTGGSGFLPAGTYYYVVSAYDAAGETAESAEVHATVGADGAIELSWDPVLHALGYWLYRGGGAGAENQRIRVPNVGITDDGTLLWQAATPPAVDTTGGKALIPIQCSQVGTVGNVAADSLIQMVTFNQDIAEVTNPSTITSGTDVESDPDLKERLLIKREGSGPGRKRDYEGWATDWPLVERVQVIPLYNGPGTVGVVIMAKAGNPLTEQTQQEMQAAFDPYPAQGGGEAPIDHQVYILLPELILVDVAAAITFGTGYSYDGANNTIATRQEILDALDDYFTSLDCGDTVQVDRIKAAIYGVQGVAVVALSAPAADVLTTAAPPQPTRGALGTNTLT